MPLGNLKSRDEIEKVLTIAEFLRDNAEKRGDGHEPAVVIGVLNWVLGTEEDGLENRIGSLESVYEYEGPTVIRTAS